MKAALEAAVAAATGASGSVASLRRQGGGSINEAYVADLDDGRRFFVKTHPAARQYPGMFRAEFTALERLRSVNAIRIPQAIFADEDMIVMEALSLSRPRAGWQEAMGRQLASLHHRTQTDAVGFEVDNYLGTMPQTNTPAEDWVSFWRERRLLPQVEHFATGAGSHDPLVKSARRLGERLDEILAGAPEPCVLLHGDLWSGNAAADETGAPVIFDPASYYGHREAELGMMQMFGGFDRHCFDAYAEYWPLADGSPRRIACYRLYHELNHLNLFGSAYYDACRTTLRALI